MHSQDRITNTADISKLILTWFSRILGGGEHSVNVAKLTSKYIAGLDSCPGYAG